MMLFEKFNKELKSELKKKLGIKNVMAIPRLNKVVINCSSSEAIKDVKVIDKISRDLSIISGQKPVLRRAKKDIANFKLRKGNPLGCSVTLRQTHMYEFMNRLINVALPRVRDFRGISAKGFDGNGNFSMGLKEQTIFPEISFDSVDKARGMTITVVTTAEDDNSCKALLEVLGMPFKKEGKESGTQSIN